MASTAPDVELPVAPEWRRESAPVAYAQALAAMEARNQAVAAGTAAELVWLLEHPPVYTAGTSADPAELVDPRFEVVEAGRGGRYTYHGPGQRIGYLVLDLNRRGKDVRCFVHAIEGWVIATLARFGVESWRAEGRVGIWTRDIDGREAKIGAIGVRVTRWVSWQGVIVPCGIAEYGVTSMARLGLSVTAAQWDEALIATSDDFLDALAAAAARACR